MSAAREWPDLAPSVIKSQKVTLFVVQDGAVVAWAHAVGLKRDMVREYPEGPFYAAWTGQYATDLFELTPEQVTR